MENKSKLFKTADKCRNYPLIIVNMKFLILISALLFLISNCKPKNEGPTIFLNQEIKDFCLFESGTWWVYKNSTTNLIDTWKIVETYHSISKPSVHGPSAEFYELECIKDVHDTFTFFISESVTTFITNKFFGIAQQSYYGNEITGKVGCDNNFLYLIRTDTFNNQNVVKEFVLQPSPCTEYFPYHTTWKRNIGLSEIIYENGDTLKLINYEIKQ